MDTTTKRIAPEMTVNDVVRQYPASISIFNEYGIDTCCGGGVALAVAAAALPPVAAPIAPLDLGERPEQRVPMSRLRARVAERLVQSQSTAAILTTFNEVNMQPVMDLRKQYQEQDLTTEGLCIFTTLDPRAQESLERRILETVPELAECTPATRRKEITADEKPEAEAKPEPEKAKPQKKSSIPSGLEIAH